MYPNLKEMQRGKKRTEKKKTKKPAGSHQNEKILCADPSKNNSAVMLYRV
jgi:hypothetical protein